jgi:hypothetical protein
MNDPEIRQALIAHLREFYSADSQARIVEELCVRKGRSRIDLAVVNERLHGFEIKSPKDTLKRLLRQLEDYRAVFDDVTFVIGLKHLGGVLGDIPHWCGVMLAVPIGGEVTLERFRDGRQNLHREPYAVAQLLWRDEALEILTRRGFVKGVKSKPKPHLWARLTESLALDDLAAEVRVALANRSEDWR